MSQVSVRLFRSGGDQALQLPNCFEMPGRQVQISKIGDKLVIEPVAPSEGVVPVGWLGAIEEDIPTSEYSFEQTID